MTYQNQSYISVLSMLPFLTLPYYVILVNPIESKLYTGLFHRFGLFHIDFT